MPLPSSIVLNTISAVELSGRNFKAELSSLLLAASIAGDIIVFDNDPTGLSGSNPPEKATELAKS